MTSALKGLLWFLIIALVVLFMLNRIMCAMNAGVMC